MSDVVVPKVAKWPFFLGDVFLLAFAAFVLYPTGTSPEIWRTAAGGLGVFAGACLSVWPFILQFRAALAFAEAGRLETTVDQIKKLTSVGEQIGLASVQWQTAHEISDKTVQAAKSISERMTAEARAFTEFLKKSDDAERRNLRLEVEKGRRAEGEWLQMTTLLLDHVYALYQAASRSGQTGLIQQLGNFQNACRDVVRRVGLVAFAPAQDVPFDAQSHQWVEGENPPPGGRVAQVVATGYTYQGQLVRRAVVTLQRVPEAVSPAPLSPADGPPVPSTETALPQPSEPLETVSASAPHQSLEASLENVPLAANPRPTPPSDQQLF